VPPRPVLSDEEERAEREGRDRLRTIDAKLNTLDRKREALIVDARRLGGEQRALFDRRQAPQAEVERLYDEHGALGKRLAELRGQRDAARRKLEEAVVHLREVRLTIHPGDRVRPDQIRREIAALELKQQTNALPIDEENALIKQLRLRTKELAEVEARAQVVAGHEQARKEAEAAVTVARAEADRLRDEMDVTKKLRDTRMGEVRAKLEAAGGLIASLRAKGKERAAVSEQIDAVSREMRDLETEGRKILGAERARREEARRVVRAYAPRRGGSRDDQLAEVADAQFQELLKRGKITLGG
jgi:uncharacterized coiled-coil DUF342 family protein